ncbi:MAG TPA: UDP-N-acetylmuramoyl-tripeptide--D-alanyl-D-alanine ligase [Tepidisphaeraceae bacterium]|nr:UDP-N-acetylmuramoyl-tripeptide--D-alanyl-D-alanine ligase [Tepidisphaeraceae bacterium]
MNPLPLTQVRLATNGKALSRIRADETIRSVSSDSRAIEPGSLFVALRGERFDGHAFLSVAASQGAVAALVDHEPDVDLPNLRFIQVEDTRKALGLLATHVRKQMSVCKVIAVAGSNGKTSTKHLIASALSCKLRGSISPKSFNNDIGVPLTIFPADPLQDYLVLEMGTNHPGEIAELTHVAQPDVAVLTNCSAEHLEGLGDLMGVRQENSSIIRGLNPNGQLVVNGDDPELLEAVRGFQGRVVKFGFGEHNDLFANDIQHHDDGTSFALNGRKSMRVFVPMLGRHNACNALAAIAVARRFGLNEDDFIKSMAHSSKPDMRLQLTRLPNITLLNDAYNANPASTRAALETLLSIEGKRRVAVLGDMLELGAATDRYHREIGRLVAELANEIDVIYCVGPASKLIEEEAIARGYPADQIQHFPDSNSAADFIPSKLKRNDVVLLKGSRGVRLEAIAESLQHGKIGRLRHAAS